MQTRPRRLPYLLTDQERRHDPDIQDKIARAPKAELHIHIEGSLELN